MALMGFLLRKRMGEAACVWERRFMLGGSGLLGRGGLYYVIVKDRGVGQRKHQGRPVQF